MSPVVLRGC